MSDENQESDSEFAAEYSDDGFWEKLVGYAKAAGQEVVQKAITLYYVHQEGNTPAWAKTTVIGALGYFIAPIDAIPDITPLIGFVDDLGVITAAVAALGALATPAISKRAQEKAAEWFGD